MDRDHIVELIERRLGPRALVWVGIRGDDARSLADLTQFAASFSIIAPYSHPIGTSSAYEDLTNERVDLETWDIDDHLADEATSQFRHALLSSLSKPSVLIPYRPSLFLSAITFARRNTCQSLGMFAGLQSAFEHKPWVESSVAQLGVPGVEWSYVADEERCLVEELLREGPVVLRRSRTSGGEGIVRVDDTSGLESAWPRSQEAFVGVARYIDDAIPVNVGATVWKDGVSVHWPSVQLVGVQSCVSRPFGYCGNDFAAAVAFAPEQIEQIELSTKTIGRWLGSHGYRGSFGVDFLVHDRSVLFIEINARFQGSSHASSQLSAELGQSCLFLEHIAAMLDEPAPDQASLSERLRADPPKLSHIVVHSTRDATAQFETRTLVDQFRLAKEFCRADILARPSLRVRPGAAIARLTLRSGVTTSGFELNDPWRTCLEGWSSGFDSAPSQRADEGDLING